MRLIKLTEVMNRTGMAKSTIYKYMDEGSFPKNVKLGVRSVAWVEGEIYEWITEKIKHRENLGSKN